MSTLRPYRYKDVDMLFGSEIIIGHCITNLPALVAKRSNWAAPFFPDFLTRVQNAFPNVLGIDNLQQLRLATQTLYTVMDPAQDDLAFFKINVEVDYDNNRVRRDEILTSLGFSAHWKDVQKEDQEAFVELLTKFKANMTPALKTELVANGMDGNDIDELITYADTLRNANVTQETAKGTSKEITQEGRTELNAIYKKVIGICKIAQKIFQNDSAKKDLFVFSKIIRAMNQPPPPPPVP